MRHASAHWEQFPHGADIGVRGYGDTQEAAFEQAALAMMAVMIDPATVTPRVEIALTCEAPDAELLLVDWLNALLYEMATRKLLLSRFAVHINAGQLQGKAWGEAMQREKHAVGVEVKGATYTALRVQQELNGIWLAQCIKG